ncbi:MAG: hypothetical protein EOP48_31420 [Sphingobacteriales bacterium]|nr:MAG: hypothetical protein EOP48_31420 [Sphingobacteriales bacterium]
MSIKFTVVANTSKKLWFCYLMVLAIGWSGVSLASVKTMHINMQMENEQTLNDPCSELQHKVVDQKHDHLSQSMQDCHKQLGKISQAQHTDCQKCSILSCQLSIAWLDLEVPLHQIPAYSKDTNTPNNAYKVQYPAGYWQEILRPPKI